MCKHHPTTYSIHDNLVHWFAGSAGALVINWAGIQPDLSHDYFFVWTAGALWGYLLMWALEIGREWIKTWRNKP